MSGGYQPKGPARVFKNDKAYSVLLPRVGGRRIRAKWHPGIRCWELTEMLWKKPIRHRGMISIEFVEDWEDLHGCGPPPSGGSGGQKK